MGKPLDGKGLRKWFEPRSNITWLKKIIWVIEVLRGTFKFVCANNSHSQDSNHPDDLFQSKKSFCSPLPFLPCSALTFRPCSPSISHIIPVYPLSPKTSFAQIFSTGNFSLARFPVAAAYCAETIWWYIELSGSVRPNVLETCSTFDLQVNTSWIYS